MRSADLKPLMLKVKVIRVRELNPPLNRPPRPQNLPANADVIVYARDEISRPRIEVGQVIL